MKRLTTDDLLREAAEERFVRKGELVSLLIDGLERDKHARDRLAQIVEPKNRPSEMAARPRGIPQFAWVPTFAKR